MTVNQAQVRRFSTDDWRDRVLADPELILEDRDLMRALTAANDRQMGVNLIDMRGIAMERLENRLDNLENTHRSVIAVAHDNLVGTNQVHRAALSVLAQPDLASFLNVIDTEIARTLQVDHIQVVIERATSNRSAAIDLHPNTPMKGAAPRTMNAYLAKDRRTAPQMPILRQALGNKNKSQARIFGKLWDNIRSESILSLNLAPPRHPRALLGSTNPRQFRPGDGTELLVFFANVCALSLQRWLDSDGQTPVGRFPETSRA